MKKLLAILILLLVPSVAFGATWFSCDGKTYCGGAETEFRGTVEANYADSTAPDGDGRVWRIMYPVGMPGGGSVGNVATYTPTGSTEDEFWIEFHFKYSENHTFQGIMDKQFYFNPGNTIGNGMIVRSSGNINVEMQPQDPAAKKTQNVLPNLNVYPTKGEWAKYTGYFKINTSGGWNGLYKAWINDTLVANWTDVKYSDNDELDNGNYLVPSSIQFVIIWGGTGGTKPETSYIYIDKVYIGDTAPDGGGTVDTTAPYVETFSPSDGTTGVDVDTTEASFHVKDGGTVVSGVDITSLDVGGKGCASCASCDAGLACSGTSADYTITRSGLSLSYDEAWSEVITVSDVAGNAMSARTYNFIVEGSPNPTLTVSTTALTSCTVGVACNYSLGATGGVPPYTWDTSAGTVPPGLTVPTDGDGSGGVPTTAGTFTATYRVTDSAAATATKSLSLTVVPADPGGSTEQSTTFADTYINSGSASTNYADNAYLRSYQWPAYTVANRVILMDNTLSQSLTAGKNIDSAKIRLWLTGYDGSGGSNPMVHHVYCSTAFDTTTATWTNFDSTLTEESTTDVSTTSNWYDFDVTACFRTAYQSRSPMYVAIDGGSDGAQDTNRTFASVDHATEAYRPQLSVVSSDNIVYLPPNAPSGHYAQSGDGKVTACPGSSSGALFYTVYYAAGATPTKASTSLPGVTCGQEIASLTNGVAYYFAFTASNAGGESGLSEIDLVTPTASAAIPSAPSYGAVVGLSGAVILSPGSSAGATSYNAYWTSNGSTPSKTNGTKITGVTGGYKLTGLTNGTTYKVVYTAVNAAGESAESGILSVTPQTTLNVNFLIGRGNGLTNTTGGEVKNFLSN